MDAQFVLLLMVLGLACSWGVMLSVVSSPSPILSSVKTRIPHPAGLGSALFPGSHPEGRDSGLLTPTGCFMRIQ